MTMKTESNIKIVMASYNAFEAGKMDAAMKLLAEDIVWEFQGPAAIPYAGIFRGRKQVAGFFESIYRHIDVEEFEVKEVYGDGDTVVVLGDERMRVKATDRAFSMSWANIFVVRDGLITGFREYCDTGKILLAYQDTD